MFTNISLENHIHEGVVSALALGKIHQMEQRISMSANIIFQHVGAITLVKRLEFNVQLGIREEFHNNN